MWTHASSTASAPCSSATPWRSRSPAAAPTPLRAAPPAAALLVPAATGPTIVRLRVFGQRDGGQCTCRASAVARHQPLVGQRAVRDHAQLAPALHLETERLIQPLRPL